MRTVKELKLFIAQLPDNLTISCTDLDDIFFIAEPYRIAATFAAEEQFDEGDHVTATYKAIRKEGI